MEDEWQIYYKMDDETLREAIELDKETFETIDTVPFDLCKAWLKKNNQIYTILKYNEKLVGYANFVPITNECYLRYRAGVGKDYFLESNDIVPFSKNTNHNCLMLSIVIKREYRDGIAINKLSQGLKDKLDNFEKQGIHISKVIQDCVSIDGIKFAHNFFGAKYVCDSLGGKIYEANLDEERKIFPHKLRYEEINEDNIKIAAKIQYDIFKNASGVGYCDYLEEIKHKDRFENKLLPLNLLVYYQDQPVGVIGLYEIEGYNEDIWLNWLGVLPEFRRKGIGTAMLFHIINLSREYNRKNFRLFSYENWHTQAISIYKKTMQLQEQYLNTNDNLRLIIEGGCKIFSCSLVDKKPPYWNNGFIGLEAEKELHIESVEALVRDGIIDESNEKNGVLV